MLSPLFPHNRRVCCCCCVSSVVSDSVRPHRRQPTRLPVPGILQARTLEWVAISKVKSESEVTQSCPTLATPWTAAYQALPSMGFSRQKYWSGVPLPSPCLARVNFTFWATPTLPQLMSNAQNSKAHISG